MNRNMDVMTAASYPPQLHLMHSHAHQHQQYQQQQQQQQQHQHQHQHQQQYSQTMHQSNGGVAVMGNSTRSAPSSFDKLTLHKDVGAAALTSKVGINSTDSDINSIKGMCNGRMTLPAAPDVQLAPAACKPSKRVRFDLLPAPIPSSDTPMHPECNNTNTDVSTAKSSSWVNHDRVIMMEYERARMWWSPKQAVQIKRRAKQVARMYRLEVNQQDAVTDAFTSMTNDDSINSRRIHTIDEHNASDVMACEPTGVDEAQPMPSAQDPVPNTTACAQYVTQYQQALQHFSALADRQTPPVTSPGAPSITSSMVPPPPSSSPSWSPSWSPPPSPDLYASPRATHQPKTPSPLTSSASAAARGLERHIFPVLVQDRRRVVRSVLKAQCRLPSTLTPSQRAKLLACTSRTLTRPMRRMARYVGMCDQVEACTSIREATEP